jgi:HD superfamily phosphodiesterase
MLLSLAEANKQRVSTLPGLDLRDVPWSNTPHFGYDHGQETSVLAHYIGESLGLSKSSLEIVKLAGLLHDIAREGDWHKPDPGHQMRSAEKAVAFLRSQSEVWHQQELIENVARLIANLDLSSNEKPVDPHLQALWDADSYESARLAPGEAAGLKVFRQRTAADRLCTPWARDAENKKVWLRYRGWR